MFVECSDRNPCCAGARGRQGGLCVGARGTSGWIVLLGLGWVMYCDDSALLIDVRG